VSNGEARIVISVDDRGQLSDVLISSYTEKAFADEAVWALRQWRYEPALYEGKPVGVRMELRFDFVARGRIVSLNASDASTAFIQCITGPVLVPAVCAAGDLDRPVQPVETAAPHPPGLAAGETGQRCSVMVDFYVDEAGRTRMPVVTTDTTPPAFAQAAVEAITQWRFQPPTRAGKPVAVRLRQEFVFLASS